MAQPNYLRWTGHGSSCGEPPGEFTGGLMHLFGIDADPTAVQALVDKLLNAVPINAVPPSPVRYTPIPLLDKALVTFMHIDKCTTPTEVIGWVPGRESAIWIPLLETNLSTLHTRVVLWAPYIFIDYAIGMATGRETWGWPKALSTIHVPAVGAAMPSFVTSTMLFHPFGANTQGHLLPLLTVTGTGSLATNSIWPDISTAVGAVIGMLGGLPVGGVGSPLGANSTIGIVTLKQFRDSLTPSLACFQAIVNSPVKVTAFNGGGLHQGNFSLRVTTCDSHRIVSDLQGVAPSSGSTNVPIHFAGWMAFDFHALPGSVVARSI